MRVVALLAALCGLYGCGSDRAAAVADAPFKLIDHERWVHLDAAADPFEDRVPAVNCPPGGFVVEGEVLEINTQICNYATVQQTTQLPISAGDEVTIVVWHLALVADAPAEAHAAVRIGTQTVWDVQVAIPGSEAVYETRWQPTADVPAGTPVIFHLHNHGFNSWRFGRISVTPSE